MTCGIIRDPILVDTDALIAVATISLWPWITDHTVLTKTTVCKRKLERQAENPRETAPEGIPIDCSDSSTIICSRDEHI